MSNVQGIKALFLLFLLWFTSLLFTFFFFLLACDNEAHEDSEDIEIDIPEFQSPEQIDKLATLSLTSQSHWMNLLDLDVIKVNSCSALKNNPNFLLCVHRQRVVWGCVAPTNNF